MRCSSCGSELARLPPVACASCGQQHWSNAKPCSGAVVTHHDKVLLVKRAIHPWHGLWDIPGGFCDHTEHPVEAAVREVREETGLEVTVVGFLGIWMDTYLPLGPGLPDQVTLNIYYHADLAGPDEPHPDAGEVSEVRWFGPDELPPMEQIAFPSQQGPVLAAWRETVLSGSPRATAMTDRAPLPTLGWA